MDISSAKLTACAEGARIDFDLPFIEEMREMPRSLRVKTDRFPHLATLSLIDPISHHENDVLQAVRQPAGCDGSGMLRFTANHSRSINTDQSENGNRPSRPSECSRFLSE